MSFTIDQVVGAAGVGNPWEIAAQVTSGDPAAIRSMATGFGQAAGHARSAMAHASNGDQLTAANYVVDGGGVHDAPGATAATRIALGDGGDRMAGVGTALTAVAGGLETAQQRVAKALGALDAEISAVVSASNALAGQRFPTQAAADAAEQALFDRAVTAVRTHGGAVATAVGDYDDLLRGGGNQFDTWGFRAQQAGEPDDEFRYETLETQGSLSAAAIATMALDVTGIFDPTPISDGLSGIISLFRGEWSQAGLSAAALVPWIGDTTKVLKFGKHLDAFQHLAPIATDAGKLQNVLKSLKHVDMSNWNSALGTMNRMAGDAAKRYENPKVLAAAEKRGLPTDGPVPFVPPKNWDPNNPPTGTLFGRRGVLDNYQNVWAWDPVKKEWDVQISNKGKKFDIFSPDGKHANISPDGTVTH